MNQLVARFTKFWSAVTLHDKSRAAVEPVLGAPRPLTGFFAGLTPEQKKLASEYDGEENHGDPEYLRKRP